jgi:flagellar biosynthesis/type III secretory pathway protein FliH
VYELKIELTKVEESIPKKEEAAYNKGYQKGLDESFEKYTQRLTELIKDK